MTEEHYRKLVHTYASAPINEFYKPSLEIARGSGTFTKSGIALTPEIRYK